MRIPARYSLVVLAAFIVVSCSGSETEAPDQLRLPQTYPSSEATNATTVFFNGSVVTTRIRSGRIINYAESDSAWAHTLDVDFYNFEGKHTSHLRADSALVRERARLLDGFGGVRIVTDDGRVLESQHLSWNDQDRLITTDSLVRITRGDDVMSGYGFSSDPELTHIRLRRQVQGRITDTRVLEDSL